MEKKKVVAAKQIVGYCDFCTHAAKVCSHCIPMKETGFKEMEVEEEKSFVYDETEFFLILFVLSGEMVLAAPTGQQVDVPANSMILFSKGDVVRITAQQRSHIVLFEFSKMPDFCERIRLQYFEQYCRYDYNYTPTPMEANVQTFLEECLFFMHRNMLCDKFSAIKQSEFFYLISVLYSPVQLAAFLHPIIGKSMGFRATIMQNYSSSLTATDLVKCFSYSRNAFYKKFHEEFGMPVKEWIVKQKIGQMRIMAMEEHITSKEMMYRCGFSSSGNFANFCKKHLQTTPTELIESCRSTKKRE